MLRDRTEYVRRVAAWQAGDWTLRFVAIWFFLGAFNVDQSLRNIFLVQVTQSLATLVPISPGGIGTEQAFIVFVFKGAVPRSLLLAFSVGMKLTLITVNVIVGFTALFLMLGHVRWRDVVGGDRKAEPSAPAEPRCRLRTCPGSDPVMSAAATSRRIRFAHTSGFSLLGAPARGEGI